MSIRYLSHKPDCCRCLWLPKTQESEKDWSVMQGGAAFFCSAARWGFCSTAGREPHLALVLDYGFRQEKVNGITQALFFAVRPCAAPRKRALCRPRHSSLFCGSLIDCEPGKDPDSGQNCCWWTVIPLLYGLSLQHTIMGLSPAVFLGPLSLQHVCAHKSLSLRLDSFATHFLPKLVNQSIASEP